MERKDEISSILKKISENMDGWAITGSFNLYLHGINIVPDDIDIILNKESIFHLKNTLSEYYVDLKYSNTGNLRSYFYQLKTQNLNIDFMSEVENYIQNKWIKHPDWSDSIILKSFDNQVKIPCLSLEYELLIYTFIGDQYKINLIKAHIT